MDELRGQETDWDDLPEGAGQLLDELIDSWRFWEDPENESYYLTVLAPRIVAGTAAKLNKDEKIVLDQLRQILGRTHWNKLPVLIAERRRWQALALERERLKEEEAARQESLRRQEDSARRQRRQLKEELLNRIQRWLNSDYQGVDEAVRSDPDSGLLNPGELQQMKERFIRREEAARQERQHRQAELAKRQRREELLTRIHRWLDSDYQGVDEAVRVDPDSGLLNPGELQGLKARFVREWATATLEQELDSDQTAAVAATGGDLQIIARAGSGKTRTLVNRAIFLQRHCGVSPGSLLLLAFNKKAAAEMRERLAAALGDDKTPHVMTFHALAHALVHPEEQLVFDDPNTDQLGLSREVQEVISQHIRSNERGPMIRELMLAHYRDDWERIVDGRFELTMDEFLAHRRSLPRESLDGNYVKSFGEKTIANALFENDIKYQYERSHRWNGMNYRPDFTIGKDRGVVIEYFGLAGDSDYDSQSQKKREYWTQKDGWSLIEASPEDIRANGVEGFVGRLLGQLHDAGVASRPLSEEEIWSLVSERAVDSFSRAMATFVGRCRSQDLDPAAIRTAISNHSPASKSEAIFLEVGASVFESYLQRLSSEDKEDFNGLVWRAIERLRRGESRFTRSGGKERGDLKRIEHVMVDEFQDFSPMFFALVNNLRRVAPDARFFCVGDDWQAINGFAGSDLRFFEDFSSYFRQTSSLTLRTNYRSPTSVVNAGNALMHGRGPAGVAKRDDAGSAALARLEAFRASAAEEELHGWDEISPAVLRIIRGFLDRGLDIVLLSRRNGVPSWPGNYSATAANVQNKLNRFLEHLRSYLPEEDRGRLHISTTHRFKGLEQSAVIVLDANDKSYPLIHPTWAFLRIFGDTLEKLVDEERRLFYVAITRAQESLVLITEKGIESPFIREIGRDVNLETTNWEKLAPVPSLAGERLEIRVSNAFGVKDELKNLNYKFVRDGKYWRKSVMAEGFSFDQLVSQPWKLGAVKLEVWTEDGKLKHVG